MEPFCQENPTTPFTEVKKLFKQQFKKDLFDVFDYFEEMPIAVGSIAQVHKAKLADTLEYVAVKIQHPPIINQTKGDFIVVDMSCRLAEYFFDGVKVKWISNDFKKNLTQEIDFKIELKNIIKAKKLYSKEKSIIIPKVYKELCSDRVLTMSFEEGSSICDSKYQKENRIKSNEISTILNGFFNRQIFEYGFVHADPHHGNIFMRKELVNGRPKLKLIMLDFGLFMDLDKQLISDYSHLWRGIFRQDDKIIKKACESLGVKDAEVFTSMVTGKAYHDVMNSERKNDLERLKIRKSK